MKLLKQEASCVLDDIRVLHSFAKVNLVSIEDSLPGILRVNIAGEVVPNSSYLLFIKQCNVFQVYGSAPCIGSEVIRQPIV